MNRAWGVWPAGVEAWGPLCVRPGSFTPLVVPRSLSPDLVGGEDLSHLHTVPWLTCSCKAGQRVGLPCRPGTASPGVLIFLQGLGVSTALVMAAV